MLWNARLAAASLILFTACSSSNDDLFAASEGGPESPAASDAGQGGDRDVQPGTLTAGAWDDNLNMETFQAFVAAAFERNSGLPPVQPEAHARYAPAGKLDLVIVIDATGSMTDEMRYVLAEVADIVDGVKGSVDGVSVRLGLVVYRDDGDDYVTRDFELTDSVSQFTKELGDQSAGGGGDYPEAFERGLKAALDFQWDSDAARVVVHIADAPPHPENIAKALAQADRARQDDVMIVPVAASGADDDLEFVMRYSAQTSGGRYVFLTDDSGVGEAHAVPHIPCYLVQRLNVLLRDILRDRINGAPQVPEAGDILRIVGTFDGVATCTAPDNQTTGRLY